MLYNMFVIAWRNALRHKQFTLLNILGLSLGITACLLISLYVQDELSYDNFHEKGDRIYRINQSYIWGDWNEQSASTGPNVALALKTDIPEFEEVTRIHESGDQVVTYRPKNGAPRTFNEKGFYVAEENFFNIFSYNLIAGDPDEALKNPSSIVLTKEAATKYFGDDEAMGQILEVRQGADIMSFTVTGVVEDVPENTHIQFDMLASMSTYPRVKRMEWTWLWNAFVTYGLVREGTDVEVLEQKLQSIPPKWAATTIERLYGQMYEEYLDNDRSWNLYLQPIREAYLYAPPFGNRLGPTGDIAYVRIFSTVGLLILILSSINFMNLSTARSANRAKEVGIRKTLGSEKRALINQFMLESVLFTTISMILAITISEFALSSFSQITHKNLSLYQQLGDPVILAALIAFVVALGVVSGSYPAFYLSSFKPIDVMKGKFTSGLKGKGLRNGLVVFQFTISVALIISTFFVQSQLSYTTNYNIGFDRINVLQIHNMYLLDSTSLQTFQNNLKNNPAFSNVGYSDVVPPNVWNTDNYVAKGADNEPMNLSRIRANQSYIELLSPKFLTGRNFDQNILTDRYGVILNAEAVKAFGWGTPETYGQDSPIGKQVTYHDNDEVAYNVIGVVEDFNFNSLKMDMTPLIIINQFNDIEWDSGRESYVSMRINPKSASDTEMMLGLIDEVKSELDRLSPGTPFEYSFMDQEFENSFRSEQQMGQVLNIFTFMAIAITCLGLFGLAAFSAEQRKKELGVRKVLGASVFRLVYMFASEFTLLIMISLVIASPVAYFFVKQWLAGYVYKTPIHFWVFILAALGALVIAWLTIGFQSVKAAHQNPVDVLRDE